MQQTNSWQGMAYGFIGVACFSLTVPFTKLALTGFSPYFLTVGRVSLAGILAAIILLVRHEPWPKRIYWKKLTLVSLGVSGGFPLCLSLALTQTGASHAGIVLAILPLLTAIMGGWINKEKHTPSFWLIAVSGCATVLTYIFWKNGITLVPADAWLMGAALSAAIAYSFGASLSRHIGGVNTICWALAFVLPLSIPCAVYLLLKIGPVAVIPLSAMSAFLYLALVSQLLGFVPWYAGLSIGGIAKVSQVQLLQPFLTLFAASIVLDEIVEWHGWAVATLVVGQVYLAKKLA